MNVRGRQAILDSIRACWASLFADRAQHYRKRRNSADPTPMMAVVVQEMILADVSGVLFTMNPVNGDAATMVIEGIFGLGSRSSPAKSSPIASCLPSPVCNGSIFGAGKSRSKWCAKRSELAGER